MNHESLWMKGGSACVDLNVHVGECEGNACEDANK